MQKYWDASSRFASWNSILNLYVHLNPDDHSSTLDSGRVSQSIHNYDVTVISLIKIPPALSWSSNAQIFSGRWKTRFVSVSIQQLVTLDATGPKSSLPRSIVIREALESRTIQEGKRDNLKSSFRNGKDPREAVHRSNVSQLGWKCSRTNCKQ